MLSELHPRLESFSINDFTTNRRDSFIQYNSPDKHLMILKGNVHQTPCYQVNRHVTRALRALDIDGGKTNPEKVLENSFMQNSVQVVWTQADLTVVSETDCKTIVAQGPALFIEKTFSGFGLGISETGGKINIFVASFPILAYCQENDETYYLQNAHGPILNTANTTISVGRRLYIGRHYGNEQEVARKVYGYLSDLLEVASVTEDGVLYRRQFTPPNQTA